MTARIEIGLVVMEDDTVLCTGCLHEHQAEGLPETAATIVYALLADAAGEACWCCGATDEEVGDDA
jgi:hypothetical protein